MIPGMPFISQIIGHFATAPARLPVCQLAQFLDNEFIGASLFLVAKNTTTELDRATGLSLTHSKFLNGIAGEFPLFLYLESFFR